MNDYEALDTIADDLSAIEAKMPTLRDLFAAFAIIRIRNDFPTKGLDENSMARQAYKVADAMIQARSNTKETT